MKTVSTDVHGDCMNNVVIKRRPGRPPKKKRGRPRRIMFPELPKPPQIKISSGCSVKDCTNTHKWMYCLPEADDLRDRWVRFLSRRGWTPNHQTRVCELHFERQMWKKIRDGQRDLQPYAFPTLTKPEREYRDKTETNWNLNFVDMLNFDEEEVVMKSELLEPEIDVLEEPDYYLSPEENTRSQTKSKKQKYLINIKKNEEKYAAQLRRERLRKKIERKHPGRIKDDDLKNEDVDMHEHLVQLQEENPVFQLPSIKVEPLFAKEEETIVPEVVAPFNNNVEEMENLESENLGITLNEHFPTYLMEKGYRCPLCKKHLSRKNSLKYHLEMTHPLDDVAKKLVTDLETRLKFRRRTDIIQEWCKTFPDITSEINIVASSRPLTSHNSLEVSNFTPVMSSLEAMPGKSTKENEDRQLENDRLWKNQLEFKTKITSSEDSQDSESNPQTSFQLPHPELQMASSMSVQNRLGLNTEVYDPLMKDKIKFMIKDASSYMFCASLLCLPVESRLGVKRKLMELVNAVIIRKLDPDKIIIAYTP